MELSKIEARTIITGMVVVGFFSTVVIFGLYIPEFFYTYISTVLPVLSISLNYFYFQKGAKDMPKIMNSIEEKEEHKEERKPERKEVTKIVK